MPASPAPRPRHRETYSYNNVGKLKDLQPGETYTIEVTAITRTVAKTTIDFRIITPRQEPQS